MTATIAHLPAERTLIRRAIRVIPCPGTINGRMCTVGVVLDAHTGEPVFSTSIDQVTGWLDQFKYQADDLGIWRLPQ